MVCSSQVHPSTGSSLPSSQCISLVNDLWHSEKKKLETERKEKIKTTVQATGRSDLSLFATHRELARSLSRSLSLSLRVKINIGFTLSHRERRKVQDAHLQLGKLWAKEKKNHCERINCVSWKVTHSRSVAHSVFFLFLSSRSSLGEGDKKNGGKHPHTPSRFFRNRTWLPLFTRDVAHEDFSHLIDSVANVSHLLTSPSDQQWPASKVSIIIYTDTLTPTDPSACRNISSIWLIYFLCFSSPSSIPIVYPVNHRWISLQRKSSHLDKLFYFILISHVFSIL